MCCLHLGRSMQRGGPRSRGEMRLLAILATTLSHGNCTKVSDTLNTGGLRYYDTCESSEGLNMSIQHDLQPLWERGVHLDVVNASCADSDHLKILGDALHLYDGPASTQARHSPTELRHCMDDRKRKVAYPSSATYMCSEHVDLRIVPTCVSSTLSNT